MDIKIVLYKPYSFLKFNDVAIVKHQYKLDRQTCKKENLFYFGYCFEIRKS
jgi:hypothetical protein